MSKKVIVTSKAPAAIGPYSQGIRVGDLLFISGQIPLDPESGKVTSGDAGKQAEQVIENLRGILEAAGMGLEHVVRTTLYLKDLGSFELINNVYKRYFPVDPPARATVEVARLPRDVEIEIDAIAYRKD